MTLRLQAALAAVLNVRCWSVIGGAGTGSVVTLGMGDRIPGGRFSANRHLTVEERRFAAEYTLFVESAWRLENADAIVLSWCDVEAESEWVDILGQVRGLEILGVQVEPVSLDLQVRFEGGLVFRVFCDQPHGADNYVVGTPNELIGVSRGGVFVEKRHSL